MKEIGEFLKSFRIQNGVSLEEASEDLNLSSSELENLEEGNVRAFKDIYSLKEIVKNYSKYLGIDADKILDEFNDFMFEHTSKISIEDIVEAKKVSKENHEKPKVISPYTYIPKKKISFKSVKWKPILISILVIILFILIFLMFNILSRKEEVVTTELLGRVCEEYEFSN